MILKKVHIENFRSIEDETIDFTEDTCKILVGINEAGKSNILKAIHALSKNYGPENIRRATSDEIIDDYNITYHFDLTKTEKDFLINKYSTYFYDTSDLSFINKNNNASLSLEELINNMDVIIFRNSSGKTTYLSNLFDYTFADNLIERHIKEEFENDEIPNNIDTDVKYCLQNKYEHPEMFEEIDPNYEEFIELIKKDINNFISESQKKVIFWEYKEENILPSEINAESFLTNPETNQTLKALFDICQKPNWNNDILKRLSDRSHIDSYIKNHYSNTMMKYFKTKWPELKLKDIKIKSDGENLCFSFIDEKDNEFNTNERSDGFKRFITFLILISGKNSTGEIKDNILIVDEPDIAIHIKGQEFLLKELLNISDNNTVVFSTHSPFMIDKANIERHYMVEKKEETTKLRISNCSNFCDEEVLNQAIGFSVFCQIKNQNVLFEGYWDNKVFELFTKEENMNIGHIYMGGVKNAQSVSKIIELQDKKYFILSDSDEPAKREKANFQKNSDGLWIEYGTIEKEVETLEDFITNSKLSSALKNTIKLKEFENLKGMDVSFVDNLTNKKLKIIISECKKIDNSLNVESFQKKLKEKIFKDINISHIEESYNKVVNYIKTLID